MSSPVLNGLQFCGFDLDAHPGCIMYKGPFGAVYALEADCMQFKLVHGQAVMPRKGPLEGKLALVAGVHEGSLWLHLVNEDVAVCIKNATNSGDLEELLALQSVDRSRDPGQVQRETGPLGNEYLFETGRLQEVFGLKREERVSIKGSTNVTVVGVLFGCLWVRSQGIAIPLPGATNEKTAQLLFNIADPIDSTGAVTPRKLVATPRSARPAFTLNAQKQVAICEAAFGNTFEADTSKKGLAQFGVSHGQTLLASRGALKGKTVTVVGVHLGNLWVLVEGDRRVSCLRNCSTGDELREAYGFGSGGVKPTPPKEPASPSHTPAKKSSLEPSTPAAAKSGDQSPRSSATAHAAAPASPHPHKKGKVFEMWTLFGRQEFDISNAALEPFGFQHGQSIKACRGADKDLVFHVVGVSSGTLWVVQEGKPRAVALRHCTNKETIQERYGFISVGKKDLSALASVEHEPSPTPIHSPRTLASALASPRDGSSSPRQALDSAREVAGGFVEKLNLAPPVPSLNFGALRGNASTGPSSSSALDPSPRELGASTAGSSGAGSSCHRNYLKAVALLKTGASSSAEDPLRFHKYYLTNTAQRLNHAMTRINVFRDAYQASGQDFERASTDDMLMTMRRRPELFT